MFDDEDEGRAVENDVSVRHSGPVASSSFERRVAALLLDDVEPPPPPPPPPSPVRLSWEREAGGRFPPPPPPPPLPPPLERVVTNPGRGRMRVASSLPTDATPGTSRGPPPPPPAPAGGIAPSQDPGVNVIAGRASSESESRRNGESSSASGRPEQPSAGVRAARSFVAARDDNNNGPNLSGGAWAGNPEDVGRIHRRPQSNTRPATTSAPPPRYIPGTPSRHHTAPQSSAQRPSTGFLHFAAKRLRPATSYHTPLERHIADHAATMLRALEGARQLEMAKKLANFIAEDTGEDEVEEEEEEEESEKQPRRFRKKKGKRPFQPPDGKPSRGPSRRDDQGPPGSGSVQA